MGQRSRAERAIPLVRFDSCDPGRDRRSFRFFGLQRVVEATQLEDVPPTLAAVEAAVAEGFHAAGYLAYEAAPAFDPALVVRPPVAGLPLAWFAIFAEREEVPFRHHALAGDLHLGRWNASLSPAEYERCIEQIREMIAAGDTYQVNFTLRLRAGFQCDDLALYERLCRSQAAGFCAYLRLGRFSILSASPELFFRWTGDELELRPMKGTRPRGRWAAEDRALAADLLASPKERAENLMIVDLLRNDAGRISRFGSVEVPRLFEVERYPTVHQLTSTVHSRTRAGTTLRDVFGALFPSGSITGAPKIRTMGIIADLETEPRGVYTGAIGFVSPGEAVFSVAIRTLVLDRDSGEAELGVGGGITYDSEPAAEYRECLAKAAFVRQPPPDFELLETILYQPPGGFFLLEEHLARLAASAERFGFRMNAAAVRERLNEAVALLGEGAYRVRLVVDREGAVRVETQPLSQAGEGSVRVCIAAEPVDSRDPLLYHKTTRREIYDSRAAAHAECDDVLLLNERGEITESTIANLVVCSDGRAWTPPLESGLLPGVFREALLRTGKLEERVIRPDDLRRADALYLINSVRRWRKAVLIS